jgi:hypothetical protein
MQIDIDNSQGSHPKKNNIVPALHNLQSFKFEPIMQLDCESTALKCKETNHLVKDCRPLRANGYNRETVEYNLFIGPTSNLVISRGFLETRPTQARYPLLLEGPVWTSSQISFLDPLPPNASQRACRKAGLALFRALSQNCLQ